MDDKDMLPVEPEEDGVDTLPVPPDDARESQAKGEAPASSPLPDPSETATEPVVPDFDEEDDLMDIAATQQLPDLRDRLLHQTRRITFGQSRDVGMVRANNEDAVYTFYASQNNAQDNPDFGVFIVADGAGGHKDGEYASTVACRAAAEVLNARLFLPMLLENIDSTIRPIPPINEVLVEAVLAADEQVKAEVPGSGTTLTVLVLIGDLAHIAHVGDSRAYLLTRNGDTDHLQMHQLTRDHSVAKRLEEIGQITAEEAVNHPEASRLWKILGLTDNLEPDLNVRRLPSDSYMLMCSDGLWNMVPEEEIKAAILESQSVQEAADRLVIQANVHGGLDNISVIVLYVP